MKNSISCPSCSSENSFYAYTCNNCKSFLRDKVYNIDLWNITGLVVEEPAKAFKQIIFADHKNFIFFLWIFIAAKMLVNTRFASIVTIGEYNPSTTVYISYLLMFAGFVIYLILFSLITNIVNRSLKIDTRFRDTLALISYSLMPNIAGIIFIFVLELVVFGGYLFSANPTPFQIKGIVAYFFAVAEFLLIGWSVFLSYSAFKTQTNSRSYGLTLVVIFYVLLAVIIYFSSKVLFIL